MAFFSKKNKIKDEAAKTQAISKPASEKAPVILRDASGVVIAPYMTEKSIRLAEDTTYVFKVALGATKPQIANAIERMYKVHVRGVSVINTRGKKVILGRVRGSSPDWRKAMVTLRKGEIINN